MPDFYLPHFYNLPPAVLLGYYAFSRLQNLGDRMDDPIYMIGTLLAALPAMMAAYYFYQQFKFRREVSVRVGLFILTAVQLATYFVGFFLR